MQDFSLVRYESENFKWTYSNTSEFTGDVSAHTHDGWEFLFVKSGELTYTVDGSAYEIRPNNLIISRPGAVHMLKIPGVIHYERHSIIAAGDFLDSDIVNKLSQDIHVLDVSNNGIILSLFEKIGFYLTSLEGGPLEKLMSAIVHELFVNVYLSAQESRTIESHSNPVIVRAVLFIKSNIRKPITVQDVSDALFITPGHLHHCFVRYMNVTPKRYIMLQKLQLVQQALVNAANPTSICQHYGFKSYSTFYRNYQKLYGHRPSDNSRPTLRKIEL